MNVKTGKENRGMTGYTLFLSAMLDLSINLFWS